MRKSFIFYAGWLEAIESLPTSVQNDALRAIVEYGIKGEISEQIKPISKAILDMAKGNIDANFRRYENGCRGGAPKGNQNAKKQSENNQKQPKNNQKQPKNNQKQPNDNVDVDVDNIYAFNKLNALSSENSENDATDAKCENSAKIDERKQADAVIDYFNEEIIKQKGRLRACRARTDRRMQSVMARIREYGMDVVQDVILKAVKSRFLNYEATNAPVDLEWIMRPNNFPKVLEGKYDDRPPKAGETGVILRPNPERYKNQKLW